MTTAIRALIWEILWKSRVVFPALALLLAFGAAMAYALAHAAPDAWWASYAAGSALIAFLTSILLGFAPFTLMETNEGWRMNSMTTRWFVLPLRTGVLVAVPLLLAWGLIAALVSAWVLIFGRVLGRLDQVYFLLVFLVGVAATQALAWAVPRKPGQFWFLAALLFLLLFLVPPRMAQWSSQRAWILCGLCVLALALAVLAWWAARRNRCGDWPGEVPLDKLLSRVRWRGSRTRDFRFSIGALFWSDGAPALRSFVLSWLALAALLIGSACLVMMLRRPGEPVMSRKFLAFAALDVLPVFGVFWLAAFGLVLGCEPATGFRTRLSSFRATLPVSASTLSAMRMTALVLAWGFLWLPLFSLLPWWGAGLNGIPTDKAAVMVLEKSASLAWTMAISLNVTVGALPLLLRGRLEGFPTLLLASISSWAWTWLLAVFLNVDENPGWRWIGVGVLLATKLAATAGALAQSWRTGQTTWRFAAALIGGWLAVTSALIWVLPTWKTGGAWRAAAIALLVPLARLACCPLAVASNRRR